MSATTMAAWAERLYDAYIFDMDGTIYLGDHLLPGARRLVEELRARSIPVRYLTNNPTKDPSQYAEKLSRLGLPTPVEDVIGTVATTTEWILENKPGQVVYPIAEPPLIDAFARAGIPMSEDPARIDLVVASYDRTFDYAKLQIAFDAIWFHRRAALIGTNPDRFCPFPGGMGQPDCAAVVAAIEACTGTRAETVLGKPNPQMARTALRGLDIDLERAVMVGDRLMTDIRLATTAGMASAMPLTGESTREEAAALPPQERPTYVLERVAPLLPRDIWDQRGWPIE